MQLNRYLTELKSFSYRLSFLLLNNINCYPLVNKSQIKEKIQTKKDPFGALVSLSLVNKLVGLLTRALLVLTG